MENGTEDTFRSMCLPDEVFEAEHGSSWMTTWRKKNLQKKRLEPVFLLLLELRLTGQGLLDRWRPQHPYLLLFSECFRITASKRKRSRAKDIAQIAHFLTLAK